MRICALTVISRKRRGSLSIFEQFWPTYQPLISYPDLSRLPCLQSIARNCSGQSPIRFSPSHKPPLHARSHAPPGRVRTRHRLPWEETVEEAADTDIAKSP